MSRELQSIKVVIRPFTSAKPGSKVIHPCAFLTQKQSPKHPTEATTISGEERTQSSTWPKNFSFANMALLTLEQLIHADCSFSFMLDRRLKVYQALSSIFWQALPLLSQSLNSSSNSRQWSCGNSAVPFILSIRCSRNWCQVRTLTYRFQHYSVPTILLQLLLISSVSHKRNKEFTWRFFK